jgi:hypothetical protein
MTFNDLIKDDGFRRLTFLFFVVSAVAFLAGTQLSDQNVDNHVLLGGNAILYGASCLALFMYGRAKKSKTAHGFTKQVYSAFVVKFFILVTSAMVYFYFAEDINTRAVFICMGLYLIYHLLGASHAARVEKNKKVQHPPANHPTHHKA